MRRIILIFGILLVCAAPCALSQKPPKLTAKALWEQALAQNGIDAPDQKPWHLQVVFHLFDENGNSTGQFSLDETWAGPLQQRRVWDGPGFHQVEVINKDGVFRTGDVQEVPPLIKIAHRVIVHPMQNFNPELELVLSKQGSGDTEVNCVQLMGPRYSPYTPRDLVARYCFDIKDVAVRTVYENGSLSYAANRTGRFRDHWIAAEDEVALQGVTRVQGEINDLRGLTSVDEQLFATPKGAVAIEDAPIEISSGMHLVTGGKRIAGKNPIYPQRARENHIQGSIVLRGIIGKDGIVKELTVVYGKDPDLTDAAMDAMRSWRFEPTIVDGKPVAMDSMFSVNFAGSY